MASRGRGRGGGGRGNNQPPPAFNQQAFMEAISSATTTIVQASVVATTIAQASANVGQGGSSTSRGLRHIIFQPSRDEGTRWKLIIGSDKLARFWRLWRSPPMPRE